MKNSKAIQVLKTVFASILAPMLVITTLFTSVSYTLWQFATPKSFVKIATDIDCEQLLISNKTVATAIENEGLTTEAVNRLLKTDAVSSMLTAYSSDIIDAIMGRPIEGLFTAGYVKTCAEEHIDELQQVVRATVPSVKEKNPTEAELKAEIIATVNSLAEEIVSALPAPEQFASAVADADAYLLELLFGGRLLIILTAVDLLLAGLIYLSTAKHFNGMLWLGIISSASGVLSSLMLFIVANRAKISVITDSFPSGDVFTEPIFNRIFSLLLHPVIAEFLLAAVFAVLFAVLRSHASKKASLQQNNVC